MTIKARKELQRRFLDSLGPNGRTLWEMFRDLANVAFYMKDRDCRIMAINARNREICNIKGEWDAIGRTSADLFPASYAQNYMSLDREVLRTGKPVIGRVTRYPADRSLAVTVANVYPLRNKAGRIVGTARAYYLRPDTDTDSARYGQIRSVAAYVNDHFDENITIPRLVAMTGLSETAFKQVFARTFAMTPGHYLTTIRLNAARKLLKTTNKPISEIAAETGFFDQSHLTRTFKKERGVTPGDYRRKHRRQSQPPTAVDQSSF